MRKIEVTSSSKYAGSNPAPSAAPRLIALDGLRGIAALVVVYFHYVIGYGPLPAMENTIVAASPLHLLWDGSAAVSLFFVLSGFVLSYGYLRPGSEQKLSIGGFYLSRFLRLLMPYALAFLLSAFCVHTLFSYRETDPHGRIPFFFIEWIKAAALPVSSLLQDGLLHRPGVFYGVMPQAWSLSVELYLSLMFPLLLLLIRRAEPVFVGILLLLPIYHYLPLHRSYPLMTSGVVSFMLGMMLARHHAKLANLLPWRAAWVRWSFLAIGVICLGVRHTINIPLKIFHPYSVTVWDIAGFGAFVVVWAALVSASFQRMLCLPLVQWLGRVSYSLYLVHMIVLYLVLPPVLQMGNALGLAGATAWIAGMVAATLLSLALAQVFYWAVEHPFTLLARRVARARARAQIAPVGAAS